MSPRFGFLLFVLLVVAATAVADDVGITEVRLISTN